jgi:hypothetical protein
MRPSMRRSSRPDRPSPRRGLAVLVVAPLVGGMLLVGVPLPAVAASAAPDDHVLAALARSSVPLTATPALRNEPLAATPPVAIEQPTVPPEPYPDREPQTSCEVVDHAGVERFRDVVLAAFPWTGDGGIVRDCHTGGDSEHKEGRAWDWMLDAHDPDDAAAAAEMLDWLLAEDADGTPHAMARRLGVLYVIWDGRIWSAARPEQGWQPYTGASPHTDHVHLSFSAAGARGETSFFADVWDPEVGVEYPATVPVDDDEVLALATPTTG